MNDTVPASVELLGIEHVRGPAGLIGLANVEMELAGVAFVVQGVRVVRDATGGLSCQAPIFHHPSGRWVPALVLPPELRDAVGAEVLAVAAKGEGKISRSCSTFRNRPWSHREIFLLLHR